MAKLCPFNTFVDAAGEPLVSGLVYTYITGTSTPKTTYTDAGAGTAHPNPVVLGANGRKEIWLATDQAYRLVIKTSAGVQVGSTIDDVLPVTSFGSVSGGVDVDISGYSILATGANNIPLTPATGAVVIDGVYWPTTAGSATQVLALTDSTHAGWTNAGVASLDAIPDVTITSATNGDLFKYRSSDSQWINSAQSTLSITASQVSDLPTAAIAFTNKTGNISQWTNDSSYTTNAAVATATMTLTNKTGNISQWTNDSSYVTAASLLASQAEVEAASSSTKIPPVNLMKNHPGVAKAWANFSTAGAGVDCTINASYNIDSITFVSGTTWRITFTTDFSSANYAAIPMKTDESNTYNWTTFTNRAAGTIDFTLANATAKTYNVVFFGDQ